MNLSARTGSRRAALLVLAAGAIGAMTAPAAADSPPKRPSIVFILADDLGYMDIRANNPDCFYDTPSIDRLAAAGMRFTQGYAAGCVCSPTRYSIMTGRYPVRSGITNWLPGNPTRRFAGAELATEMSPDEVTLAEALKPHGYRTAFVGKWHLGEADRTWPEHQGFDVNIAGWSKGSPRSYFSPYENPRLPDGPKGEHLPKRLVDESLRLMEQWRDEPFLLFLSFYSVHTPLQARPDLEAKYRARAAALPPTDDEFVDEEQIWPDDKPRRVRVRQSHAVYAAMVEAMDEQIGRLLDGLSSLRLDERTIVVFTSDNGGLASSEGAPTSNAPLRAGKGWLYEGGIREPMIVRVPGVTRPGSTCDAPIISPDFYPTFLDLAGLPAMPEQHLDGVSIRPLLAGEGRLDRDALFWHYPHYANQGGFPGGIVRMGDWKLIERYEDGRLHLYNLADDPDERTDVAERHPDRVAPMRDRLHAWHASTRATFLRRADGGPEPWRPSRPPG